jgi:phosphate transport system substrate-binding protein
MEEPCQKLTKLSKKKCGVMRSDGHFIEAGENDNLIVQKLTQDAEALGIFGFSFLEENHEIIKAAHINDVTPSFESIVSGTYPVSRPLFIYFKKEHLNLVPGIKEFIQEIVSKNTIGKDGYLLQKGLIPLTDLEIKKVRGEVTKALK